MEEEILEIIYQFNKAWTEGDISILAKVLHKDVIFIAPDLKTQIIGKENCIHTIKAYNEKASTSLFDIINTDIKIWDDSAILILSYYIEYSMNNKSHKEHGTEFWSLKKIDDGWKILWRAMVSNKEID